MTNHEPGEDRRRRPRPENEEKPRPGDLVVLLVLTALLAWLVIGGGLYITETLLGPIVGMGGQ